jgi:hypothetical protein
MNHTSKMAGLVARLVCFAAMVLIGYRFSRWLQCGSPTLLSSGVTSWRSEREANGTVVVTIRYPDGATQIDRFPCNGRPRTSTYISADRREQLKVHPLNGCEAFERGVIG